MKKRFFLAFALLGLLPGAAFALCGLSVAGLNFSPYDVLAPAPNDTVGNLTITCDEVPPPNVTVSIGASPASGGFSPRRMRGPFDLLDYNIYTEARHANVWGDGTNSTNMVSVRVPRNNPATLKIYGRIPPQQNVSAGSYADTLVVTITW